MTVINVKGMSCQHCVKSISEALAKIPGVKNAKVDLEKATASWEGADSPADIENVKKTIRSIGFESK